jgi:hypothetical protein
MGGVGGEGGRSSSSSSSAARLLDLDPRDRGKRSIRDAKHLDRDD